MLTLAIEFAVAPACELLTTPALEHKLSATAGIMTGVMREGGTGADDRDFDPRVRMFNEKTGEVTAVERDAISGLDDFVASWRHNVDLPDPMRFEAWQMADDDHPAGSGRPAYRLVHKTIRTVVLPGISMTYPNAQIRLQNGAVTVGEPRFDGAISWRRPGSFLLPEWGEVTAQEGSQFLYTWQPNTLVNIRAHQETLPPGNYLEILYQLPEGADWSLHEDMLAAGRAGVAPVTALLDFVFGERVLGPILAEEVGEVFDDWHWNRRLGGRTVGMESQARIEFADGMVAGDTIDESVGRFLGLPDEERQRCRVASQWYWRAQADPDPVQRFISHWLVVEALELDENANIAPVKDAVATVLAVERSLIDVPVGRLYGLRSKLVHGKARTVEAHSLTSVAAVAAALLERHLLGVVSPERLADLRASVDLTP